MKYLFNDKVISKVKKVPEIVWIMLFAITLFVSNAFNLISDCKIFANEMVKMYSEAGVSVKYSGITVMLIIGSIFIYALIFELLARWICRTLIRRFRLNVDNKEFVLRLRLIIGLSNMIIGLINLISLISADAYYIVSSALNFPIVFFMLIWFYSDFRKNCVPSSYQAKLFNYVAKYVFGIYIIVSAYFYISQMFILDTTLSSVEIVSLSLDLGMKLIMAVVAYFYSKFLKKHESALEEPIFINFQDPFNPEEKEDDKIFKDFDI